MNPEGRESAPARHDVVIRDQRYQLLVEHAPEGIVSVSADGQMIAINPGFQAMTGWSPAQIIGRSYLEFVYPEDQPRIRELFESTRADRRTTTFEVRLVKATGGFCEVEVSGFSSVLASGQLELHGIFRDITAQKAAERLIRQQNRILINSHEGVAVLTGENEISLWNRAAENLLGWTAAEATGRRSEEVFGWEDAGLPAQVDEAVRQTGQWKGEAGARNRKGGTLFLDMRVTGNEGEAGGSAGRLILFTDVTERKLVEEKLYHAQRLESLGMLAAGIAHDLNNVLAPIMFTAPLLRKNSKAPGDLKLLDILEASAARGAGLVKQILGFVHTTTGQFQTVQVKHLVRDLIGVIELTFPKSITLEQAVAKDLWPILGDATQVHQILLNLCVNARDAMPAGGVLRVAASNCPLDAEQAKKIPGARAGTWILIEIVDTGTGIPPEVLARMFEPFFSTKAPGKGTGLGLSTARGLLDSHHGFLEVRTEVGRGSSFRVYLPAAAQPVVPAEAAGTPRAPRGAGELILVVDDEQAVRLILEDILTKSGYRVATCADGVEALAQCNARRHEIRLLITDVDMPRLDGLQLARAVAKMDPKVGIIGISGLRPSATDTSGCAALQREADGFLFKPFDLEPLLETVGRVLAAKPA